ncbi:GNAT family N-acetyltransferase [Salinibius halmophilus]|uniref:GNAT family N-acetyltransferase n=1 Tax=Salinibius halmophilus TaxID=1853216 RepID=UPI001314477A|nr:GNAT family N-acetyltransferase [Salinibius halmophilus]
MPDPNDVLIRPVQPSDEAAIVDICYETRSVDIAEEGKYAFALRWALPYLRDDPQFCFVAVIGEQVIGYIVGTPDTKQQVLNFERNILPEMQTLIDGSHPFANQFLNGGKLDPAVTELLDDYPAHLHINMTSDCRGLGVGARLIKELEHQLISHNVTGIHLGVNKQNMAAVRFYQHQGYDLREGEADDFANPWMMTKTLG